MLNELFQILTGVLIGILTGLVPGLHVNTVIPLVAPSLVLIGIGVSHTFFDFIPSLLLGVPDESSSVASLPGHRLVMSGDGETAFLLSVVGGALSVLFLFLFLPIVSLIVSFEFLVKLIVAVSLIVLVISSGNRLMAFFIFAISACLSLLVSPFDAGVLPAYFTGLFGVPTLLYSFLSRSRIPLQRRARRIKFNFKVPLLSSFGGLLSGFLPGMTSSVSAVSINSLTEMDDQDKVMLVGGINTVYAVSSVLAIWFIGKPRSGLAIAVRNLGTSVIPALFIAVGLSAILAWYIGPFLFRLLSRMSSSILNLAVMVFILLFVVWLYPSRFPVFVFASSLGMLAYSLGLKRTLGLGFLILPILTV